MARRSPEGNHASIGFGSVGVGGSVGISVSVGVGGYISCISVGVGGSGSTGGSGSVGVGSGIKSLLKKLAQLLGRKVVAPPAEMAADFGRLVFLDHVA